MFCPNCAKKNAAGAKTCEQCGSKISALPPPVQRHHQNPKQAAWKLKRKQKFTMSFAVSARFGGAGEFDIVANGTNQGKIKSGKTIVVYAEEELLEVVVKAWGLNPLKTVFKLEKENAHAELGMWKKNIIFYSVSGAEVEK
ncbi:MAG: zinc ribbon domain-containing protein [Oscillospiraceae bacterium]|nr:zinc ribbon domain-containing protein [Oscillospiraceae bacterium]